MNASPTWLHLIGVFNLTFIGLEKPLYIMSNHRLIFYGTETSRTTDHELTCLTNFREEIYISIDTLDIPESFICLDKSTAIKFAKTLRTEINKIKEVNNG